MQGPLNKGMLMMEKNWISEEEEEQQQQQQQQQKWMSCWNWMFWI